VLATRYAQAGTSPRAWPLHTLSTNRHRRWVFCASFFSPSCRQEPHFCIRVCTHVCRARSKVTARPAAAAPPGQAIHNLSAHTGDSTASGTPPPPKLPVVLRQHGHKQWNKHGPTTTSSCRGTLAMQTRQHCHISKHCACTSISACACVRRPVPAMPGCTSQRRRPRALPRTARRRHAQSLCVRGEVSGQRGAVRPFQDVDRPLCSCLLAQAPAR
jgi:hypothetical protein